MLVTPARRWEPASEKWAFSSPALKRPPASAAALAAVTETGLWKTRLEGIEASVDRDR